MDSILPDTPQKQCNTCLNWHPRIAQFFEPRKESKDGFRNQCRVCIKAGRKVPKKPTPDGYKQCSGPCQQFFLATPEFFHRDKNRKDGTSNSCKECAKATTKAYYRNNIEHCTDYHQRYREEHIDKIKDRDRRYNKEHSEQKQEYNRQYYGMNQESLKAYSREYNRNHKEEISVQKKLYDSKHRDEKSVYRSRHYIQNIERYREQKRNYYKTERGRAVDKAHAHRRRAQKRACLNSYTARQLQEQMKRQKFKCYYCKANLKGKTYHADHIVPLSRGGGNDIDNIVLTCPTCNLRKHDKFLHEWPEGGRLL